MMGGAAENVPDQEVNLFDAVMDRGDPLAAYFAVQSMALRYQDGVGREGQMIKGKAPNAQGDVFNSQAEVIEAQSEEQLNEAWQHLIDTGLAWSLQGWFGRCAKQLIEEGICKEAA